MEAHMNDKNISFETVLKHFYSIWIPVADLFSNLTKAGLF
jgi:hypothetical protein